MNFNFQKNIHKTPVFIKSILILTASFSILSALFKFFLYFLGLSLQGIKNIFIWQIATNLFIIPNNFISFNFAIHLLFNLYLIWLFGSAIYEWKGKKQFLILTISMGLLLSSLSLFFMFLGSSPFIFSGNNILVYMLAITWMTIYSEAKILLFFSIPMKGKYLILTISIFNLLSLLSEKAYIYFFSYLSSIVLTYLFIRIFWKLPPPFEFLKKLKNKIFFFFQQKKDLYKHKIYDFKTKKPIDSDEMFMDAMLNKISTSGKDNLTKKERRRMEKISKKSK